MPPVGGHRNGAVTVGSENGDTVRLESLKSLRRRMAVLVTADRNHPHSRMQRIEPAVPGASPAPVVAYLEQAHWTEPRGHRRLGRKPGVARQERLEIAVLPEKHKRILVQI